MATRRERARYAIGAEERRFTDEELDLLLRDTIPVLTAAGQVAERATGIGRKVWERAGRQSRLLHQWRMGGGNGVAEG